MPSERTKLFAELRTKISLKKSGVDLIWCDDLRKYKTKALKCYESEDHLSLMFEESLFIDNHPLQFHVFCQSNTNYKIKNLNTTFKSIEEAKIICEKLKFVLGTPDEETEEKEQLFVYWEDQYSRITVSIREHHGGFWYEYSIETKNCK